MKDYVEFLTAKEVVLEKQTRVGISKIIPKKRLIDCDLTVDDEIEELRLTLEKDLYGVESHKSTEDGVFVPLNWWEHFKERWFPSWVLQRRPVRKRFIATTIKHVKVCPHIDIPGEDRKQHITFLMEEEGGGNGK